MQRPEQLLKGVTTLGDAIRTLREDRGMTLRALAEKVDISAPFLSDIEHNRRSTDKLADFARVLRVPVAALKEFDGRLPADVKQWINANPQVVALLKDLRASGRRIEELRAAVLPLTRPTK